MSAGGARIGLRPLTPGDLEAVIAIDHRLTGAQRRGFYEKRLTAALNDPKGFIYLGVCEDDVLAGFAFCRLLGGEFGREDRVAALDAIGIDPDRQHRSLGRALMDGIDDIMARKGVREMQTQARWTDHVLLAFFDAEGFRHAGRVVLERDTATPLAERSED